MLRNMIGLALVIGTLMGASAQAKTLKDCQDECWDEFKKETHDCGQEYVAKEFDSEKFKQCVDEKLEAFKVCIKECK